MNVIVTNNHIDYTGFIKVLTLQEAEKIVGDIDVLVYHKSNESQESKAECLTRLKDIVRIMVYISSTSTVDKAVQMIIVGSGGKYFDDEFFLENSAELSRLIGNLDGVIAITELGGLHVVTDFINKYLNNGSSNFNPAYLSVVNEALSNIVTEYKQNKLELIQISETATDLFSRSIGIVESINKERESLKEVVKTLEIAKEKGHFETMLSTPSSPNLLFFPTVSYLKETNIIRIKEIGNFSYLVSFMLGFRIYLERIKLVKPKLIFLVPVGSQYEMLYKDFNWVTSQSNKTMGNYYANTVFTNFPNKEVVHKLLRDEDYDTFIVVDMLKSDVKHLLNSKGTDVMYAVSGMSALNSCGIKSITCFSNSAMQNSLFTLETFSNYPADASKRERRYLSDCASMFETLYKIRRK